MAMGPLIIPRQLLPPAFDVGNTQREIALHHAAEIAVRATHQDVFTTLIDYASNSEQAASLIKKYLLHASLPTTEKSDGRSRSVVPFGTRKSKS